MIRDNETLCRTYPATLDGFRRHHDGWEADIANGTPTVGQLMIDLHPNGKRNVVALVGRMASTCIFKGNVNPNPIADEIAVAGESIANRAAAAGLTLSAVSAFFYRMKMGDFPEALKWSSAANVMDAFRIFVDEAKRKESAYRAKYAIKSNTPEEVTPEQMPISWEQKAEAMGRPGADLYTLVMERMTAEGEEVRMYINGHKIA